MKKNSFAFLREGEGVKSLLVVAMMIITASFVTAQEENEGFSLAGGRFGEINLKLGWDFESVIKGHAAFSADFGGGMTDYDSVEPQFMTAAPSIGAEYLFPIPFGDSGQILYPGFFKLGLGVQYLFTRKSFEPVATDDVKLGEDFSFLPIYAIVQLNPAKTLPGLFFRGIIGYSLLLQQSKAEEYDWDKKGGLHWGMSVGYETAWGFFVEYAYTQTYAVLGLPAGAMGPSSPALDIDFEYGKSSIFIGYKIKL
jgi:hypothetical protein